MIYQIYDELSDLSDFVTKIFSKIPKIYHILSHCKMTLQIKKMTAMKDGNVMLIMIVNIKKFLIKTMNILERNHHQYLPIVCIGSNTDDGEDSGISAASSSRRRANRSSRISSMRYSRKSRR